jgi:hypothetical protein
MISKAPFFDGPHDGISESEKIIFQGKNNDLSQRSTIEWESFCPSGDAKNNQNRPPPCSREALI